MISIPAFCDNCKQWTPSPFQFGNVETLRIKNISFPCRRCKQNGVQMIDGTFSIIDETLEIIESNGLSPKELNQLARILKQAIDQNTPAGKLREIIAKEVPKGSKLNKFITEGFNLPFILALLVAILAWQCPVAPSSAEKPNKAEAVSDAQHKTKPQQPTDTSKAKVGVNDPCICGSGKKSKKCCGSRQKLVTRPQNTNKKPK